MTTPEHLTHFWGPAGTSTPVDGITVDLRVGGAFETVMVNDNDGSTYTMRAVYTEVTPPDRLEWRDVDSGVLTSISFVERPDGTTEVVTRQVNVPPAYRSPEPRAGFTTSLDRFDAYLAASHDAQPDRTPTSHDDGATP
jgi:uncharacterized protein YndB with AHSA1/START domain